MRICNLNFSFLAGKSCNTANITGAEREKEKTTTDPPVDATHDDMSCPLSTVVTTAVSSAAEASSSKILQNPIRRR